VHSDGSAFEKVANISGRAIVTGTDSGETGVR